MSRRFYNTIIPFFALGFWALSAVTLVVQAGIWLTRGEWVPGQIGDVILGLGFAEPVSWLGEGSVYSTIWTQPVSVVSLAAGLALIAVSVTGVYQMNVRRI